MLQLQQTNEVTETTSIIIHQTPIKPLFLNKVHLLNQHLPLKLIQVVLTLIVTTIQSLGSLVQVMSQQMVISIVGVKCQTLLNRTCWLWQVVQFENIGVGSKLPLMVKLTQSLKYYLVLLTMKLHLTYFSRCSDNFPKL